MGYIGRVEAINLPLAAAVASLLALGRWAGSVAVEPVLLAVPPAWMERMGSRLYIKEFFHLPSGKRMQMRTT